MPTVQRNLFKGEEPLGQRFRIRDLSCEVIGTLVARGQGGFGNDQDDVVLMPIKTVQRRFTGNRNVRTIMVQVDAAYDTAAVTASIQSLLRERRNITGAKPDNFNIFDTAQIAATLQGTTKILTALLGAVAAVSLLVGGIGIMNIMLVSVTERTREIGIRLAIGAVGREVLLQFLVEAVVLACLGGVVRPAARARRQLVTGAGVAGAVPVRSANQRGRVRLRGPDRSGLRLLPGPTCREPEPDRRAAP